MPVIRSCLLLVFVALVAILHDIEGHPLCFAYYGPFIPTEDQRPQTCTRYSNYTCCTKEEEDSIAGKIDEVLGRLNSTQKEACEDRIREVLCLRCSPYFSHTFDYEKFRKSEFPGLCKAFCYRFYNECGEAIKFMTGSEEIITADTADKFCDTLTLSDPHYCYPDVNQLNERALDPNIITQTSEGENCICLEEFASTLRNPLIFRAFPDNSGRILVGEQRGTIYLFYLNGTREPEPFLDIESIVAVSNRRQDERGLLSLAFHPQFTTNNRLFIYFTIDLETFSSIVIEISVDTDKPIKVDYGSGKRILAIPQPRKNHNGGELFFGFDGYLYLSTGDGGGAGDTFNNAQNKTALLGKMLRIDVDNVPEGETYGIPADNPYVNESNSRHEIFAIGLRNPWRCDLDDGDPQTGEGKGRIFCGDVGQGKWEEVSIVEKGKNYGWNSREGYECFRKDLCDKIGPEVLPIHTYSHEVGKSITGGHVYRGCQSPALNGKFIFADFEYGSMFWLTENKKNNSWSHEQIFLCSPDKCGEGYAKQYEQHILSFGEDINGEIYMLTAANVLADYPSSRIYKIVDPKRKGDLSKCRLKERSNETPKGTTPQMLPDTTTKDSAGVLMSSLALVATSLTSSLYTSLILNKV